MRRSFSELEKSLNDDVKVKGRFGSVDDTKTTKVIVFNISGVIQRKSSLKSFRIVLNA